MKAMHSGRQSLLVYTVITDMFIDLQCRGVVPVVIYGKYSRVHTVPYRLIRSDVLYTAEA